MIDRTPLLSICLQGVERAFRRIKTTLDTQTVPRQRSRTIEMDEAGDSKPPVSQIVVKKAAATNPLRIRMRPPQPELDRMAVPPMKIPKK